MVVATEPMVVKGVSADNWSLCSLIMSLQSLEISSQSSPKALAFLAVPSSMLKKGSDSEEGEKWGFLTVLRTVVFVVQKGVAENC